MTGRDDNLQDAIVALNGLAEWAERGGAQPAQIAANVQILFDLVHALGDTQIRRIDAVRAIRARDRKLSRAGVRNRSERVRLLVAQTGASRAAVYRALSQAAETTVG